ncbi:exo-alpha-sialidase [Acinetobacter baumannii]|nr:exo-alpha-sialidase [Acinetobacter baumannii]
MADQIVTRQQLVDAGLDAESLQKFISGLDSEDVLTRLGQIYPSLAKLVRILMETGGWKAYSTEAELLATVPTVNPSVGYAFDTKKLYLWNGTSWIDEGLSPLDQAKAYIDKKILVKTSVLKLFNFVDVNSTPVFSIYKNGTVWIKGLKLDVAAFINSLNTKVDFLNSLIKVGAGKNYFVFNDVNNLPLIKLNQNKDLFIPKIGNLTEQALLSKKITSKLAQSLSSAAGAEYADNVLEQLTNSQSSTTLTAITAAQVNDSGIFPHPVTMLRIPAITRIAVNKYLCFFEARRDGDDFGENSQGVVTLTVDQDNLTVSATNLQSLHSTYVDENNKRWSFMNACAVKLDSGRIIVLYVKRNGTTSHALYKRYSDDDGVTWSEYEDIGHFLNMPFYNLLCPCSQGLVKRFGSNRGRIIFPVWYSGVRYRTEEFRAGYIYSDDDGETWHDGSFNNETMSNEVQCAEDVNGDILFCIRREVTGINTKTWSKLLDGDFKLTPFTPHNQLCETPIMSGLIQAQNKFDKSNAKFHYVGTYSIGRKNLKLFTSFNGGSDWTHEYDVANTNITSVYSCIERLSPTQCFVLWEADYVTSLKCQILSINETNTGKQAQEL